MNETKRPNECCNDPRNIESVAKSDGSTIETCKVCGRRHYTVVCDVNLIGLAVSESK